MLSTIISRATRFVLCTALSVTPALSLAEPGGKPSGANPYAVERSWPDYFLEHQKLFTEKAGTYRAGEHRVWTVHVPGGWIGNRFSISA